jgi:hypothetical protein
MQLSGSRLQLRMQFVQIPRGPPCFSDLSRRQLAGDDMIEDSIKPHNSLATA